MELQQSILPANLSKQERYEISIQQLKAVTEGEGNLYANLGNCTAVLKYNLGWFWVGFYLATPEKLILGPFQGTVACTTIPFNKGVCGAAYTQAKIINVPDVEAFPGHIACSAYSKSEVVVPIIKDQKVVAVLDIDSDVLNSFDSEDEHYLSLIAEICASFSGWKS